jgi:hexosaminidase
MYERLFQLTKQLDEQGLQHITAYERGLRRLCTGSEFQHLKTLTDLLVPVRGYKNLFGRLGNPTRLANNSSPLSEAGDIVAPDSEVKRIFRKNVAKFLEKKDEDAEYFIRLQLQSWAANHSVLVKAGMNKSRYANLSVHSANLQKLSETGLIALDKILAGQVFTTEEMVEIQKLLTDARKPQGDTELDIILEIESLIKQKMVPEPKEYSLL